ncbi:NAD-dependent epimerase/dehydratase family protein [bacterium]|nr:NAD-dependent epimerase/dehydratase family protein [bacterium]
MKVLVTGANGFVGAALCRLLLQKKYKVRGLVRETSDLNLLNGISIEKVYGSLKDRESLKKAVDSVDIVFHVAAKVSDWGTFEDFRKVNVEGTRNLIEASISSRVKRFVLISSVAVHSFIGAENMNEDSPQLPTRYPYCQTKREAEALVMQYHKKGLIDVTIVRPGDVYGPGDRTSLLKMSKMLKSGTMGLIGRGRKLGAFVYVENLAYGIYLAGGKASAKGRVYVITDGVRMTWREYFDKLTSAIGVPGPRFSLNPVLAWFFAFVFEAGYNILKVKARPPLTLYLVDHLTHDFHFTINRAEKEIGYKPIFSTDEAIRRTAEWFVAETEGK